MLSLALLGAVNAGPFIVFDKKVTDESGKVGRPVHVFYQLFNVGDSAATDLRIDDSGIPLEQWEFSKSASNLRWNSLAPGQNITHIFEVTPLVSGSLRMGASRLRYMADGQKKIALSSQVFWFEAKSTRSIGAKGNIRGYGIVVGAALVSVFVPFLLWRLTATPAPLEKRKAQ